MFSESSTGRSDIHCPSHRVRNLATLWIYISEYINSVARFLTLWSKQARGTFGRHKLQNLFDKLPPAPDIISDILEYREVKNGLYVVG